MSTLRMAGVAAGAAGVVTTGAPATGGDDVRCMVCLEDFAAGDAVRSPEACPHTFHAACLEAWLRSKPACPICKTPCVAPAAASAAAPAASVA